MRFYQRIKAFFSRIFNRYEAAQRTSDRSHLPASVQDARFDASAAARTEIMRKARYFEKNNAIIQRIGSVFCDYVVGPTGLTVNPNSTDAEWNKAAKAYWETTAQFIDFSSRQNFGTLQGVIAWCWLIDGEIFILKTRGQSSINNRTFPRIQLIESHRVGTPPNRQKDEGKTICDGVEIDANGRPTGYHVKDSSDSTTYRFVESKDMIHVFEPARPGMYRGLSFFHAVINDLHQLDDLEMLEMRAANDSAEKSTFIFNAAGQLNRGELQARALSGGGSSSSSTVLEDRTEYFRSIHGGRTSALKQGDTVQQFVPNRPSEAQRALWDYLTTKVCIGVGIPKQLIIPYPISGGGGAIVRGDYHIANSFFKARSAVIAAACREVYLYVIGWGRLTDRTIADVPGDGSWVNVTIRPPRSVTADIGNDEKAILNSLQAGTTTFEEVYSQRGLDWQQEMRQRAKEAEFIRQLSAEFNVDASEISNIGGQSTPEPETAPAPDPEEVEA